MQQLKYRNKIWYNIKYNTVIVKCIYCNVNNDSCGNKDICLNLRPLLLTALQIPSKQSLHNWDSHGNESRCEWERLLSHQGALQSLSLSAVLKLLNLISLCVSLRGAETFRLQAPKSAPHSLILSSLHDAVGYSAVSSIS